MINTHVYNVNAKAYFYIPEPNAEYIPLYFDGLLKQLTESNEDRSYFLSNSIFECFIRISKIIYFQF